MAITAAQVKELREITGIGMMECKKALTESNGDIEKADREALEWGIKIISEAGKAYVVSISSETDFLAISDKFKAMISNIAEYLKENGEDSKEAAQTLINSDYALELGENLQIQEYKVIKGGVVWSYVHSNNKLAAVVVAKAGTDEEKVKQIAMHITAANPEYLSPSDISEEVIEKEQAIQLEIMKNDPKMGNKSDDILLKIIGGKMGKFKSEISLLEQDFVIDPNQKIKAFIGEDTIVSFTRFSI